MFFHKNPSNLFVCSFQWLRLTHRTVLLWDGGRLTGERWIGFRAPLI